MDPASQNPAETGGFVLPAAHSQVVPGSFSAANLGSGFDRWSRSSPAALTQQGPTPRGPAVPLDPHWEGRNQPGRGLGVIGAPSTWNAVPGEAGNGDTECLDGSALHSRCCQGKSHAGTQPGSGSPCFEILLNPILPPLLSQPFSTSLGSSFFHERRRSMPGKGRAGRSCPWTLWPGKEQCRHCPFPAHSKVLWCCQHGARSSQRIRNHRSPHPDVG